MKVIVWGLGYVGTVVAACLAKLGHEVIGVDKVAQKVNAIDRGKSPIKEPGLDSLIQEGLKAGRLGAVSDGKAAVASADVSLICVGTPSAPDGSPVLDYLEAVAAEIGQGLRGSSKYHVVVLRSTVFPKTTRHYLLPLLEQYGRYGQDFGLVMNPEFLRETTAIADFFSPPYTVIGELEHGCACAKNRKAGDVVEALYQDVAAPLYRVDLEVAETLKMANNSFHALKIGFANEMGRLCDRLEIDASQLMDLLCADNKLNISEAYLRPGFAFGGSCLPKDLRSLVFHSQRLGVDLPILESVLPSNQLQIEGARLQIHALGVQRLAVLGLSFKPNTDDLRESPTINLIQQLWRDGLDIWVYDPDVQLSEIIGSNRDYLERQLPQIEKICCSTFEEATSDSDAVIITQNRPEFIAAVEHLPPNMRVLNLVSR